MCLQQVQRRVEVGCLPESAAGQGAEQIALREPAAGRAFDPSEDVPGVIDDRVCAHVVEGGEGVFGEVAAEPGGLVDGIGVD